MSGLQQAKKELRQKIKGKLSGVTPESTRLQSEKLFGALQRWPQYQKADNISVYLSMPQAEISTDAIVRDALQGGKRVFVPYFYKVSQPEEGAPKSIMDMVELSSLQDYQDLKPDGWGIPTPSADSVGTRMNSFGGMGKSGDDFGNDQDVTLCPQEKLDLVLLPGMAFDKALGRLGHGKGFYDYFLYRTKLAYSAADLDMPILAGLSLEEQLLPNGESVPIDETDWQLDTIVCGSGTIIGEDV